MFSARKITRLVCAPLFFALAATAFAQTAGTAPATATATAATPASPVEKTVEINRAAKVVLVEGDVAILTPGKRRRALAVGDMVNEGDSIVTGSDGELHLDMEDGGYISVRPNTKMRIAKYQAKGEDSDSAVIGLLEGGLRSVTGWIGKFNRNKYVVRTPNATVGIRGTDHEPYVIPKGSSLGEPGTYDKVNEGGSFIQTPAGRADVTPNQAGFVSHDKGAKPRVLSEIPKHFRPGKFEQRFAGKHAEVQGRVEKRREERRTEIKQKLQSNKPAAKADAKNKAGEKQLTRKEKREAAIKAREDAKKAREAAKKEKEEKRKAELEAKEAEKAEKGEKGERLKAGHKGLHK